MDGEPRLVLASRSPRRFELLASTGLTFGVAAPDVDERVRRGEAPRDYVLRLAREKALDVVESARLLEQANLHDDVATTAVLAADTTVVTGGKILGKPRDRADAARMLRLLSGKAHDVFTGVAACRGKLLRSRAVRTRVWMRALSAREIAWYLDTPEPYDKAGAYAIQGTAGAFITRISGSASNVIGLPLPVALSLLEAVGHPMPWSAR
jgi:septum formation protein